MYGNDRKVVVQQSGMGLGTLCFFASLIFLVLKVAGVISWSWWLVFAPLLVYVGLVTAILLIVLVVLGIVAIIMSRN